MSIGMEYGIVTCVWTHSHLHLRVVAFAFWLVLCKNTQPYFTGPGLIFSPRSKHLCLGDTGCEYPLYPAGVDHSLLLRRPTGLEHQHQLEVLPLRSRAGRNASCWCVLDHTHISFFGSSFSRCCAWCSGLRFLLCVHLFLVLSLCVVALGVSLCCGWVAGWVGGSAFATAIGLSPQHVSQLLSVKSPAV